MTTQCPDTITVTDMDGEQHDLVWLTDEDDPDGTLICEACEEPLMAGYGTFLGAGGWIAYCVECCPSIFIAPE